MKIMISGPPSEWPTIMNGGCSPAAVGAVRKSLSACAADRRVRWTDRSTAFRRGYRRRRVSSSRLNRAPRPTRGEPRLSPPASKTTVGVPVASAIDLEVATVAEIDQRAHRRITARGLVPHVYCS